MPLIDVCFWIQMDYCQFFSTIHDSIIKLYIAPSHTAQGVPTDTLFNTLFLAYCSRLRLTSTSWLMIIS
ncbi:hypothetical protein BDR05DRAFT_58971 [Suillus weaverae]|nr:hypothetical protein BDR05DRAFT_58971 [Suillus weaverae]